MCTAISEMSPKLSLTKLFCSANGSWNRSQYKMCGGSGEKMSFFISGRANEYVSIDNDTRQNHIAVHATSYTHTQNYIHIWLQRLIGYPQKMNTNLSISIHWNRSGRWLAAGFPKSAIFQIKIVDALHKGHLSFSIYNMTTYSTFDTQK